MTRWRSRRRGAVRHVRRLREAFRIHRFGGATSVALQGLTLQVEQGEIVVVLGPSGSGKTTLLRTVAAFDTLSAGVARVLGTDVGSLGPGAAALFRARNLGLLDQHYARALSPDLTCVHTVGLGLELLGSPRSTARTCRRRAPRAGRARRPARRPPGSLSGGEQQRVALCAALAHRPRLLLADEPAGELDAENAKRRLRTDRRARARAGDDRARGQPRRGGGDDRRPPGLRPRRPRGRGGPPRRALRRWSSPSRAGCGCPTRCWRRSARPHGSTRSGASRSSCSRSDELDRDARHARAGDVPRACGDAGRARSRSCAAWSSASGASATGALRRLGLVRARGTLTAVVGPLRERQDDAPASAGGARPADRGPGARPGPRDRQALDRAEAAAVRREHVALVTQEPGLVPHLSARENVELGLLYAASTAIRQPLWPRSASARG